MTCLNCHQPIEGCPVGDYCWCNGYIHAGAGHQCPRAFQPTDGWPLANLADPDWDALFGPRTSFEQAYAEHAAAGVEAILQASQP